VAAFSAAFFVRSKLMSDPHHKEATIKAYVTSLDDVRGESYETTMSHHFGIGAHCGSTDLNMHVAYLEPGRETRAHFHLRSDIAMLVLEGESTLVTWDQNFNRTERTIKKGDFVFIPRGVIHKDINRSGARFGLVACYNHVGTGPESLKIYVEPPLGESA